MPCDHQILPSTNATQTTTIVSELLQFFKVMKKVKLTIRFVLSNGDLDTDIYAHTQAYKIYSTCDATYNKSVQSRMLSTKHRTSCDRPRFSKFGTARSVCKRLDAGKRVRNTTFSRKMMLVRLKAKQPREDLGIS